MKIYLRIHLDSLFIFVVIYFTITNPTDSEVRPSQGNVLQYFWKKFISTNA